MKILSVCDVLFPQTTGGAGRVARELAEAFMKMGAEIEFLTRFTGKASPSQDKVTYFPPPGKAFPAHYRKIFLTTVERFNPDLIHIQQPFPAFLSIPSSFSKPLVYTFHSSWPEEFKMKYSRWPRLLRKIMSPFLAAAEKRTLHRATAITVLSQFSNRQLKRLYNREGLIIPGGVDSERFQPIEKRQPSNILRLVSLRNLVPRMGLSQLIRAMQLLPPHLDLTIGGEGPLRNELMSLIHSLDLSERVRLTGHVPDEDLPHFYSSANWFVLPTVALEGFGLVTLESLSCGTPVLGTRIGATPELLETFDPAWIIEKPTPKEIAATILRVIEKPAPSPADLHHRVAEEFDWRNIAKRYLEMFESLV
ncbi:MAG: glycosyltransferase family 4 protein [Acidobacteria bacterium]|nr:glycosyltransferase family 4 protein [Acidobacteriota bacterium]